jgi:hypothetical protein
MSVNAQGLITVNSQMVRNAWIISEGFFKTVGLIRNDSSIAILIYAELDRKIY